MATRLYLTNAPASYNPGLVRGAWDANGGIVFGKRLGSLKQGAQLANGANEASGTSNWDVSLFQFVSDPISENATLSGTMDYVLGLLGATSLNARTHIHVWVTAGPTTTARGTLLANNIDTTNWPTSPTSFAKTALALNTVNAIRGDRIVVEIGYRAVNTSTANLGPGVMYAGGTAGDLAASDDPVATGKASWVEFSFDIPTISQPVTYKVSANADDARNVFPGQSFSNSVVTQHLGKFNATTSYDNGWRWLGIPINQGATVISAKLVLFSAAVFAGTTASVRFYGVLENSCTPFANNAANIPGGKTKTTATVDKNFAVADWTNVGYQETDYIDVTSLIQEIVDQPGWVAGGNIGIVARDNGSANTNYIGHSTHNSDSTRGAKLVLEFLTGDEPDAPSGFTATENAGNVDLAWTDNSDNELNFEIQRKRGDSVNWYEVAVPAADAESATDDDVDAGYTYTYRIRAVNAAGGSVWVEATPVVMSGTKTWTAKNMAWVYPGAPAENADEEYSDGRYIHFLKPEYYTVNGAGALVQLVDPADGENAYNSTNAADIKDHSEQQFFLISSAVANNIKILCEDHVRRTNAINTIISFLNTTGFTGVELDFEDYGAWTSVIWNDYKTFVTELGDALHTNGYKLIIDGPPITNSTEQAFYQWKYEELNTLPIDHIVMLLFDYQYDNGAGTSVQPLSWMRNGVKWMRDHIDTVDKIVIAIPSYGYHGATGGFSITIDTKEQSSAFTGYETATRNADGEMTWTNGGNSYVFQDAESMNIKREAIEDEGIRYVSVWHLGGNDWFDAYSEIQPAVEGILIYEDSFNRADADDIGETDGAGLADPFNYEDGSDESGFEIASNQLLSHNSDGGVFMPMIANGSIEMDSTPPTGGVNGIIIRFNFDTGDGYALLCIEDAGEMALSLFLITGFAPDTSIWDSSETYDLGSTVKVQAIGTTLNVYVDGVDVSGDIVDTHSGSGNVGMFADTGGIFDNLAVYGINTVPEADDQSVNVLQNTPTEITLTASDDDGDPLIFKLDSLPTHGTLISPERVLSSDSFNRSDGALGDTDGSGENDPVTYQFSPGTTYAISGNRAVITDDGGGGGAGVLQNVTAQDIQVKVKVWPNAIGGVAIHAVNGGGGEGYSCYYDVGDGKLKLNSGFGPGSTLIDEVVTTWNDGDELKVVYQGGDLSVYQNDSLKIGPVTDVTYLDAGDFTSLTGDTGTEFDDLEIRALETEYGEGDELPADTVTYVPDTDYIGPDEFDFTVLDDLDESAPATISITVIQTNYELADTVTVTDNFGYALSFPLSIGDTVNVFDQITKTVVVNLEETVTVSDEIDSGSTATYQREFDDEVTVSDEITGFVVEKHIAETVTVTESIQMETFFMLMDSVTVSDQVSNTVTKNLSETVSVSDDMAEVVQKGLAETVNVAEARSILVQKSLSDTVSVSDAPSNITTRPLADTVTVSDASFRTITKGIADTVVVSDNFSKVSYFPFEASETVNVTDQIVNTVEKNLADTVLVSEELIAENEARLTENVNVDDEISLAIEKALSDTVNVSDNFGKVSYFPFEASDTVNVNDQISKQLDKYLEDTVNVNDATTRETSKGLAETVNVSDEQLMSFVKTLAETVTVTDQFSTGKNIQLSESVNTNDEISKAIEKVLSETVSVADNFSRTTETSRLIEEEVTVTDSNFFQVMKNLAETITVSDQIEAETSLQRELSETVVATDARSMTVIKVLADTVTVSDEIDTQEDQIIADTVNVSDQIIKSIVKTIVDTVTVSDSPSTAQTLTLDRSETVTVTDVRRSTVVKVLLDSVSVSDEVDPLVERAQAEADVVTVTDVISKAVSKALSETVTVSDTMDTDVESFAVELNDVIIVTDQKSINVVRTKMYDGNGKRELFVNDYQSISELKILDSEGNVVETIAASDFIAYPLNSYPKSSIYLRNRAFPRGRANVLIVGEFTSGAVPEGVVAVTTWLVVNYLRQLHNAEKGEFESESIEGYTYRLADGGANDSKLVKSQLEILDSYRKIRI